MTSLIKSRKVEIDSKPVIGFVILVWNSSKVISKCLRSIMRMQAISQKVMIVNNGSTDDTSSIVDGFIRDYPTKISKMDYPRNMGTTVPRNAGLRALLLNGCDYYCILDSDTEINDDAFVMLIGELEKHPEYGMIGPKMATSEGVVQMSARGFPTALEKLYKAVPIKALQRFGERMEAQQPGDGKSYPVDYLMSACWLLRPELLQRVGLLDEKIFYAPEDAEYCIRVWKAGYRVAYCPDAKIIHEWQRLSKKKLISRINWEHVKGLAHMFKKHRYLFSTKKLKLSFKARQV